MTISLHYWNSEDIGKHVPSRKQIRPNRIERLNWIIQLIWDWIDKAEWENNLFKLE